VEGVEVVYNSGKEELEELVVDKAGLKFVGINAGADGDIASEVGEL